MKAQEQLDEIKQQLISLTHAVEALQQNISESPSSQLSPETPDIISALAGYLALRPTLVGDELLETTLRCAMHGIAAGGAGLTLFDEAKNVLVFQAAVGDGAEGAVGYECPMKGSRHGQAFRTLDVVNEKPEDTGIEEVAKAEFRNVLVVPLLVDGEAIGTLSAVNKRGAERFSLEDSEAYQLFAGLAAQVVRQAIRGQLLEQYLIGKSDEPPLVLEGLQLNDDDRLLLETVQKLCSVGRNRSRRLEKFKQMISLLDES